MSWEALVFSDLHFGDPRSRLHRTTTLEEIRGFARDHRPIRRLILLGDILDLQMANWSLAIEGIPERGSGHRSPGFRRFLNDVVREAHIHHVHYVPGNHDYRVFDYLSVDRYLMAKLATGKRLDGRLNFYRTFRRPFLRGLLEVENVGFDVVYPHLELRFGDRLFVLAHGHMLDASQGLGVDVRKALVKVDPKDEQAVARARHNFFRRVGLYQSIVDGGAVNQQVRHGLYRRAVQAVHAVATLGDITRSGARGRAIDRGLKLNILTYVSHCCRARTVDAFVFGHTHRAGRTTIDRPPESPLHVWNCGTFLEEEQKKGPTGTFLLVSGKKDVPVEELVESVVLT